MVRKGQRVQTLTKVVGQTPRSGVVVTVQGDGEFLEIEWDDGRTSIVSAAAVVTAPNTREKRQTTGS